MRAQLYVKLAVAMGESQSQDSVGIAGRSMLGSSGASGNGMCHDDDSTD
ncbi:hypothetical protein [Vibrio lentus]|nr:hypothetical protein [Vibrio lentus]MCC5526818.1 hypothetical protein [Vibrio lentus]